MNKTFRPVSKLSSALSAAAALLATASILAAIGSLADHYGERTQSAAEAAVERSV